MKKQLLGWKVVSSNMTSMWQEGPASRVYCLNHKTTPLPDAGPLCVFKTREIARVFLIGTKRKLFRCKYAPSNESYVWTDPFPYGARRSLPNLPDGTRLADSVTLIKKAR